jgi:glutamyl/glutaminyl-tRNA synthetase
VDERPVPEGHVPARRGRAACARCLPRRAASPTAPSSGTSARSSRSADEAVGDRHQDPEDVEGYAGFAFRDPVVIADDALAEFAKRAEGDHRLNALAEAIEGVEVFELEPLEAAVRALADRMGVKAGDLFFPARVALTGRKVAPGIFEVDAPARRRKRTLERLRKGAELWAVEHAALRQSS